LHHTVPVVHRHQRHAAWRFNGDSTVTRIAALSTTILNPDFQSVGDLHAHANTQQRQHTPVRHTNAHTNARRRKCMGEQMYG